MSSSKTNALYVADLPKDVTQEDIKELFEKYHFLYVNLNSSKSNNIWAQVFLESEDFCTIARHELNGFVLKGKPIRICNFESKGKGNYSNQNLRENLLIKNIDPQMTQKEFYQIFLKYGDINSAKIEYDEEGKSKGMGFVCYYSQQPAEDAKNDLNNKQFYGKKLTIEHLIPYKSNTMNNNNTLFVANFPKEFNEEDLKKLLSKYGEIKFASINKDKSGVSRGSGLVSFTTYEAANVCIQSLKKSHFAFPGLSPLMIRPMLGKDERQKKFPHENKNVPSKVQFSMLYSTTKINDESDLEKEIRLFIKVVMLEEYIPKEVEVDMSNYCGTVTFKNKDDADKFFDKYEKFKNEMHMQPSFECHFLQANIPVGEVVSKLAPGLQNVYPEYNNANKNPNVPVNPMNQAPNYRPQKLPMNQLQQQPQVNSPQEMNVGNMPMQFGQFQQQQQQQQQQPRMPMPQQMGMMNQQNMQRMPQQMGYMQGNPYMNNMPNQFPPNNNPQMMDFNNQFKKGNNRNYKKGNNKNNKKFYGQNKGAQNAQMQRIVPGNGFNGQPAFGNNVMVNQFQNQGRNINVQKEQEQMNDEKQSEEIIDHRNLENLNPAQLQSQFAVNQPVQYVYNQETCNIDDNEELANEIADTIYGVVAEKHPKEASKITGMIKEMGAQKMNMLLSKKEDLLQLIDKAYDMIVKNNEK